MEAYHKSAYFCKMWWEGLLIFDDFLLHHHGGQIRDIQPQPKSWEHLYCERVRGGFIVKVEIWSDWGMCEEGRPLCLSPSPSPSPQSPPTVLFLSAPFIPRKREGQTSRQGSALGEVCVCVRMCACLHASANALKWAGNRWDLEWVRGAGVIGMCVCLGGGSLVSFVAENGV